MTQYMVPVDDAFVESVAKGLAKSRMEQDAQALMRDVLHASPDKVNHLTASFDKSFEAMWASDNWEDEEIKEMCRQDARSVISIINLKLLTL